MHWCGVESFVGSLEVSSAAGSKRASYRGPGVQIELRRALGEKGSTRRAWSFCLVVLFV